jgi:putative endonuclease
MPIMHFVYILYSVSRQRYYIGYTADPDERVIKHNSKHKGFTNGTIDWKIVYTEQFETKKQAISREKQIKAWKSRQLIEALVQKGSTG